MRALIVALLTMLLAACGFQLRGAYTLPFDTLHIALPETAELRLALKRNIEVSTKTRVVMGPKEAQAVLTVLNDTRQKNILSLSPGGRVREFQMVRNFTFRLHDPAGRDLLPPSQIFLHREVTFSDAQILAKEAEETLLWRDIESDLVHQLLRRLSAAKLQPAEPEAR